MAEVIDINPVSVQCTVVPDGVSENDKLNVSVVLTPIADEKFNVEGISAKIALETWPTDLSGNKAGEILLIAHYSNNKTQLVRLGTDARFQGNDKLISGSQELWNEIFTSNNNKTFDLFREVVDNKNTAAELNSNEAGSNARDAIPLINPRLTKSFDLAGISKIFSSIHTANLLFETLTQGFDQEQKQEIAKIKNQPLQAFFMDRVSRQFESKYLRNFWLGFLKNSFLTHPTDTALGRFQSISGGFDDRDEKQLTSVTQQNGLRNMAADIGSAISSGLAQLPRSGDDANNDDKQGPYSDKYLKDGYHSLQTVMEAELGNSDNQTKLATNLIMLMSGIRDKDSQRSFGDLEKQLKHEVSEYLSAHEFERPIPNPPNTSIARKRLIYMEGVRRKLAGIRSHPTLGKFLRMIHDFAIDADKLDLANLQYVSAIYADPDAIAKLEDENVLAGVAAKLIKTAVEVNLPGQRFLPKSRKQAISDLLDPDSEHDFFVQRQIGGNINEDGLLNLRASYQSLSRYDLQVLDTSQAIRASASAAQTTNEMAQSGALPGQMEFDLPLFSCRGIEMTDNDSAHETTIDIALARHRKEGKEPVVKTLYAEDLHLGTRYDIAISGNGISAQEFCPAFSRLIEYPQINEVYRSAGIKIGKEKFAFHPFKEFRHRDEGFALPMSRTKKNENGELQPVISPRMIFWTGDPLSTPAAVESAATTIVDCDSDLPISINYDLPETGPLLPVLRNASRYLFVGRARFINGGGAEFKFGPLKEVKDKTEYPEYWKDKYFKVALGKGDQAEDQDDTPFPFTPPDVVPAPELLFLESDPLLVKLKEGEKAPPDKLHQIIIRTYSGQESDTRSATRIVAPPSTSFEQAEQQGQFDKTFDSIPPGGLLDVDLNPHLALFPYLCESNEFINGKLVQQKEKVGGERGPIFRGIANNAKKRTEHYYIDARARRMCLALEENGDLAENPELPTNITFQPESDKLDPVALSVIGEQNSSRGSWIEDDLPDFVLKSPGRKKLTLAHLGVHIGPAEEFTLNLWCPQTAFEAVSGNLNARQFVAQLAGGVSSTQTSENEPSDQKILDGLLTKAQEQRWDDLTGVGMSDLLRANPPADIQDAKATAVEVFWRTALGTLPSMSLNAVEKIQLIHAVQRPLLQPEFPQIEISYLEESPEETLQQKTLQQRALRIVRLSDGPQKWNDVINAVPKKADYENNYPEAYFYAIPTRRIDKAQQVTEKDDNGLSDEMGGNIGYILGRVELDRKSTGSLRCDMLWRDVSAAASLRHDKKQWHHKPAVVSEELFNIEEIAKTHDTFKSFIDLLTDDQGKLRNLSYDFGKKARRLALRIVATSRFSELFEKEDPNLIEARHDNKPPEESCPEQNEVGLFETESASYTSLCKKLHQHNCPRQGPDKLIFEQELWIKSTERPPIPDIRSMELLFRERTVSRDENSIMFERKPAIRVRLGDNFASGEGELIALVLLPADLVDTYPKHCPENGNVTQHRHVLEPGERKRLPVLKEMRIPEDEEKSHLARHVTAWGEDPTVWSNHLDVAIPPSHFAGYCAKMSNLLLTFKDQSKNPDDDDDEVDADDMTARVAVIAFQPKLHKQDAYWYIDIDADTTTADSPFLRCSFARYQPQSLAGKNIELSRPVVADPIQIPPKRTVEIRITKSGHVSATVRGAGYTRRSPAFLSFTDAEGKIKSDKDSQSYRTNVPHQNYSLKRKSVAGDGMPTLVQAYDKGGAALEALEVLPVGDGPELSWTASFSLPQGANADDYVLRIFESELNVPDVDEDIPVERLVVTPRTFACDIALAASNQPNTPVKPSKPGKPAKPVDNDQPKGKKNGT
ncbi:MAG: hypothetical protein GY761_01305 [Hyphomicrobiales bacterium]|nr:hypothetical protein [Hyphomicrobiales bacterium]